MNYIERVRGFSPNARLLLYRSLLVGLNFGIWAVLFNLYLLSLGFDKVFVAQMISVNWLAHGALVIPAGIISDLIGRRTTYLWAYSTAIIMRLSMLFVLEPSNLLMLNAIAGMVEGFHAITGPPFMAEQSRPEERVHLFSISATFVGASLTIGSLLAGLLPLFIAKPLGITSGSAWALRSSLLVSIPLSVLTMLPIYLIKEKWRRVSVRSWFEGLTSKAVIGMLGLTAGIEGLALGFTLPFYNVMFAERLKANPEHIGVIFSIAAAAVAGCTLFSPLLVAKLGRVKTIFLVQVIGVPFLVSMMSFYSIPLIGGLYILRKVFSGTEAGPGGGLSIPVERLFSMEIVRKHERGTTNGIIHSMSEFPMALTASIAGPMMERGDWTLAYYLGGALTLVSFIIYFLYFRGIEAKRAKLGEDLA